MPNEELHPKMVFVDNVDIILLLQTYVRETWSSQAVVPQIIKQKRESSGVSGMKNYTFPFFLFYFFIFFEKSFVRCDAWWVIPTAE